MQFGQLLILAELLLIELESFTAHFEEIEDAHLIYELGRVVRVEQDILAQLATLQVLSHKPIAPSFLTAVFVPILLLLHLHALLGRALVFECDGEIYLFVEHLVDPFLVVVDDIQEVILGGLSGVDHVQVLHLAEN
jgi:hypothetical protein